MRPLTVLVAMLVVAAIGFASGVGGGAREMPQSIVWITEEFSIEPPEPRYTGRWDPIEGVGASGSWNELDSALVWARAHAPIVLLRLRHGLAPDAFMTYSVGEKEARGLPWRGELPTVERSPVFAGLASITEEEAVVMSLGTYRLIEESSSGTEVERVTMNTGLALQDAIAQGRALASVVVLRQGVPGRVRSFDVGRDAYQPHRLPRLADEYLFTDP